MKRAALATKSNAERVVVVAQERKTNFEQAVRESLRRRVPPLLARYLIGGENATVEEVRILQVGREQGDGSGRYWPIKVYAKGTCSVMFGGRKPFEGEAEYMIKQDPYGKWVVISSKF